jgi:hypothetical protein
MRIAKHVEAQRGRADLKNVIAHKLLACQRRAGSFKGRSSYALSTACVRCVRDSLASP